MMIFPIGHTTVMVKCALALGLVALLITEGSNGELGADDLFYLRLRPRLGHLPDVDGYLSIFEDYFNNAIRLNDKKLANLDVNDWRKVRPTGEYCLDFLQSFQIKRYQLAKPHAIIALDACLGWLFDESDEKATDLERFNVVARIEVEKISKDKKLAAIYSSTDFKGDKVPQNTKQELHEYLLKLLKVYADNPRSGCHGLWLEAYTDFVEDVYLGDCDTDEDCPYFGYEAATRDSYLKLVVDSTKQSSTTCYKVMQKQIKGIMRQAYEAEMAYTAKLSKRIKAATSSKADKQSEDMKWGKDMTRILQLVSGSDQDSTINLAQVVRDLNKLRSNDEDTVDRFTEAIGKYAIQNVNLKDSANDPEGRGRFGKAVTKLCRPYINPQLFLAQTGGSALWQDPSENKNPFEFYNIVYGLIRLTNHLSIYGISKDKFEEDVLKNKWESLYLATFACQLISITWGELNYDTNEEAYSVSFRSNEGEDLIEDWPLHVMLTKLVDDANSATDSKQQPEQKQQQQQQQQQQQPSQNPSQSHQLQAEQADTATASGGQDRQRHISTFKFNLFSKSKRQKSPKSGEPTEVPKSSGHIESPKKSSEPIESPKPTHHFSGWGKPQQPKTQLMSLDTIMQFKNLHGRNLKLSPEYYKIYPSLLEGADSKTLTSNEPEPLFKPQPQPQSQPPRPNHLAYSQYGQAMNFGGPSGFNYGPRIGNNNDYQEPKKVEQTRNFVF